MVEEVNRYIHEKIMGKCWHDIPYETNYFVCKKCGEKGIFGYDWHSKNPYASDVMIDYCSEGTPRAYLKGVVEKVINIDYATYASLLVREVDGDLIQMLNPTAKQIATVCMKAHQASIK